MLFSIFIYWVLRHLKIGFEKVLNLLSFGWYIRYILEMNQYMLISSINEINAFHVLNKQESISLTFAFVVIFIAILLIICSIFLALSSYEAIDKEHNMIGELFSGVKMQKMTKLYVSVLLIRRASYVVILLILTFIHSWILIWIMSIIQLWYIIYISIQRPFTEIKWNIIEILNELYFWTLLSSLFFLILKKTGIFLWQVHIWKSLYLITLLHF